MGSAGNDTYPPSLYDTSISSASGGGGMRSHSLRSSSSSSRYNQHNQEQRGYHDSRGYRSPKLSRSMDCEEYAMSDPGAKIEHYAQSALQSPAQHFHHSSRFLQNSETSKPVQRMYPPSRTAVSSYPSPKTNIHRHQKQTANRSQEVAPSIKIKYLKKQLWNDNEILQVNKPPSVQSSPPLVTQQSDLQKSIRESPRSYGKYRFRPSSSSSSSGLRQDHDSKNSDNLVRKSGSTVSETSSYLRTNYDTNRFHSKFYEAALVARINYKNSNNYHPEGKNKQDQQQQRRCSSSRPFDGNESNWDNNREWIDNDREISKNRKNKNNDKQNNSGDDKCRRSPSPSSYYSDTDNNARQSRERSAEASLQYDNVGRSCRRRTPSPFVRARNQVSIRVEEEKDFGVKNYERYHVRGKGVNGNVDNINNNFYIEDKQIGFDKAAEFNKERIYQREQQKQNDVYSFHNNEAGNGRMGNLVANVNAVNRDKRIGLNEALEFNKERIYQREQQKNQNDEERIKNIVANFSAVNRDNPDKGNGFDEAIEFNKERSYQLEQQKKIGMNSFHNNGSGEERMENLVEKLSAVNRDNPEIALALIDSILRKESRGYNVKDQRYTPNCESSPIDDNDKKTTFHNDGNDGSDDESDVSSITNPTFQQGPSRQYSNKCAQGTSKLHDPLYIQENGHYNIHNSNSIDIGKKKATISKHHFHPYTSSFRRPRPSQLSNYATAFQVNSASMMSKDKPKKKFDKCVANNERLAEKTRAWDDLSNQMPKDQSRQGMNAFTEHHEIKSKGHPWDETEMECIRPKDMSTEKTIGIEAEMAGRLDFHETGAEYFQGSVSGNSIPDRNYSLTRIEQDISQRERKIQSGSIQEKDSKWEAIPPSSFFPDISTCEPLANKISLEINKLSSKPPSPLRDRKYVISKNQYNPHSSIGGHVGKEEINLPLASVDRMMQLENINNEPRSIKRSLACKTIGGKEFKPKEKRRGYLRAFMERKKKKEAASIGYTASTASLAAQTMSIESRGVKSMSQLISTGISHSAHPPSPSNETHGVLNQKNGFVDASKASVSSQRSKSFEKYRTASMAQKFDRVMRLYDDDEV